MGSLSAKSVRNGRSNVSSDFQALVRAGLRVQHFGEHPDPYWDEFPRLKPELRGRIPMTFSLLARK